MTNLEEKESEWAGISCVKCKQPLKLKDPAYLYSNYDFAHVKCSPDTVTENNPFLIEKGTVKSILEEHPYAVFL